MCVKLFLFSFFLFLFHFFISFIDLISVHITNCYVIITHHNKKKKRKESVRVPYVISLVIHFIRFLVCSFIFNRPSIPSLPSLFPHKSRIYSFPHHLLSLSFVYCSYSHLNTLITIHSTTTQINKSYTHFFPLKFKEKTEEKRRK